MDRRACLLCSVLLGSFFISAGGSACRSAKDRPVRASSVHAVESEELELIMRQLERMDKALLPQEIDPRTEERRQREAIAQLADAIARSADGITAALDRGVLPPDHHQEFRRLTHDLVNRAQDLRDAAPELSTAELVAQVTRMRRSCTACHARFRILPDLR